MGGGGGGDGGAAQRQADLEAQKQQARDRLNAIFGEAPSGVTFQKIDDGSGRAKYDPIFNSPTGSRLNKFSLDPIGLFGGGGFSLLGGGGGGGGGELARKNAEAAQLTEQLAREAAANKTAREQIYSGVRDSAFTAGKRKADEQNTDAARNLKFSLFAQGLNGGSTDIDQNALLKRKYDQGILDLGAQADSAAAGLRGSDESTRLGLLQSINAGTDQGSAISSALNQMKVNSDKAAAEAAGTDIGDLFANSGLLYQRSQAAQGVADARDLARLNSGTKKPKAYTGQITSVGGQ